MELPLDDVRQREARTRLHLPVEAVSSAVAALNAGAHIALIARKRTTEEISSFASLLVAGAAEAGLCVGSLDLYAAGGALIPLRELLQERFLRDFWVTLVAPTPTAITRVVDEVRNIWRDTDARLLVVTTDADLRDATLAPAAARRLIPISI